MAETTRVVLAIDQGTTGTTVLLVDQAGWVRGRGYREIPQSYPQPGWVEHDPEAIWASVLAALHQARAQMPDARIAAIGITNQRETAVIWDRKTGAAVRPAIVWQDRRTADACQALRDRGLEPMIQQTTGLLLDPYFSGTKVQWMLDQTPGLRARADSGQVAFGTIDSYLIWRLTGGQKHVTDVSNASRTLLLDLKTRAWNDELLSLFNVPRAILPDVVPSSGVIGTSHQVPGLPDGIPISGVAGDQQAALFGQDCLQPGTAKCTFGTGSFLLMNIGEAPVISKHRLLTSIAWTVEGITQYALEGSAFISGALIQWLRDGLGIIASAGDSEALARSVPDSGGVVIVPAFAGLGAPHWRAEARGTISGITRGTTKAHIARAALEAMALQNVELLEAMQADAGRSLGRLRVDGGATANDLLMQMQADFLGVEIERPAMLESTALGAAKLALRGIGETLITRTTIDGGASLPRIFRPTLSETARRSALDRFRNAVTKA